MDIDNHALKRGNWAAAGVSPDFLKKLLDCNRDTLVRFYCKIQPEKLQLLIIKRSWTLRSITDIEQETKI